ncbi:MAG: metallophosphoesterase [Clostridia bacterium]|nr:metallophosphoesterase [Clostridia bacterium]
MNLNITHTTLEIGAIAPIKLLHITDAHTCLAYDDEGEKLTNLARRRAVNAFGGVGNPEKNFMASIEYAKKQAELVACSGDMYDFLSRANFDFLDDALSQVDYIYAAGNHDFCTAPGADVEDGPFKARQMKLVAPHIKNDMIFYSRIINGINLICLDDSYYQFYGGQLEMLKKEAEKGLPIVLFMHNPIYTKELAEEQMKKGDCAYVVEPPKELRARYPKDRADYQRATEETEKTVEYIKNQPLIKAIFAGHLHCNFETAIDGGVMQYITGGLFFGDAREITIK